MPDFVRPGQGHGCARLEASGKILPPATKG